MAGLETKILEKAFELLNAYLAQKEVRADLYLVGGAVMCLVHRVRPATKDVDAWFTEPEAVREAARRVAEDIGISSNWLNDAAKAFVPANADYDAWKSYSHLTVSAADARTMLAMKCASARAEQDKEDIRFLAGLLGLRTSKDILAAVSAYFPEERLPPRSRFLLEEMFDESR